MYSYLQDFPQAVKYLKKALKKMQGNALLKDYEAYVYGILGISYVQQKEADNAIKALLEALKLIEQLALPLNFTTVLIHENLGHAYADKKELSPAIKAYAEALEIAKLVLGADDGHVGNIYNSMALAYADAGVYDFALENQKLAYEILLKTSDDLQMLEMIRKSLEFFRKQLS